MLILLSFIVHMFILTRFFTTYKSTDMRYQSSSIRTVNLLHIECKLLFLLAYGAIYVYYILSVVLHSIHNFLYISLKLECLTSNFGTEQISQTHQRWCVFNFLLKLKTPLFLIFYHSGDNFIFKYLCLN